ncbi:MAG TPA: hypothetical protein ENI95_15315, partial [Chloroflexi bacterium]|nr:hypothetical protein [Chloroflexota bacterium]
MQFSDTVILMILLLVTVALTGGFLYAFIQATNERRRRGEEAARRGWEHRVERNAARLAVHLGGRLSDGTPWRIEIVHLRSGSGGLAGHYTRWWCEDVRLPGAAVVIGPAGEIFASSRGEPLS